ncbi:testis-expressed protein 2-like isoform X2 [Engraulis encrasicolus]|uniref:testis-expressed protein 2-like isoform X2 n=1 Tax=Engraulis encrasicolus TaxID=184585 RepID=UPI002FD30A7E
MSSRRGGHADRAPLPPPSSSSSSSSSSGAKRQVQRLRARDGITIQFSALGKEEEEEEEELYGTPASTPSSSSSAWPVVADGPNHGGGGIAEALEASETLGNAARQPLLGSSSSTASAKAPAATSTSSAPAAFSSSSKFSPSRSITFPSGDKPFLSLMKSLSQELVDPRTGEGVSAGVRHRKIMQNLVKSLSSSSADTSSSSSSSASQQQDSSTGSSSTSTTTSRPLDSRLNLQLFKQFTQSRASTSSTTATATTTTAAAASSSSASSSAGDSKTAPSSPMTSPDSSRFSFRPLSDVEARIEDTKRRLSEVMLQYEPLQRLSKMIDESNAATSGTSGTASKTHFWQKGLSSSASELSTLNSSNGHLESNNNNYCIKEEGEGDFDRAGAGAAAAATGAESNLVVVADGQVGSAAKSSSSSSSVAALDKCSMSALARQEDEEFCELYSEDFDFCTDIETTDSERTLADNLAARGQGSQPPNSTDTLSEDEDDEEEGEGEELAPIPYKTLFALTLLTYGYFVVPLPSYVGGMVFGMVLGVMLAMGVIFLAGPRRSNFEAVRRRIEREMGNTARLDLKEQGMVKGWMNEIQNYDPETYHATLTNSVFVRLDGSTLRLSKPNRNIARRAALNEPKPDVTYISQRIYELADSKIYLVPNNLARKRIWNKKYPICVELGRQDNFMSKAEGETSADSEPERSEEGCEGGTLRYQTSGAGAGAGAVSRYRPTLFLFGRTGREKEEWYQRLLRACSPKEAARRTTSLPLSRSHAMLTSQGLSGSRNSLDELLSSPTRLQKDTAPVPCPPRQRPLQDYGAYMARCMPPPHQQGQQQQQGQESSSSSPSPGPSSSPQQSPHGSPGASKKLPVTGSPVQEEAESLAWVNALVGRVAWDFLGEEYWSDWVCKKIQMKLSKIRLPYFMNELTLTELDMGATTPRVLQASKPSVDHQGLWFDLEVCYKGSFLMTLETKMNLARLGKEGDGLGEFGKDGPRAYCLADSDEESSSAGSSDEEEASEQAAEQTPGAESFLGGHNKHSKILRFVDKLTKNKYFQKAAETEFIKKKMEEVSNTPLLLTVEVQECRGTLAVNIPPPPTDRIWYGFRTPPKLEMRARPKLGEREVTFVHITDFIEKKLYEEFQKILVMPNMDDVWLHIMHSAMDPRSHGSPDTDPMGTSSGEL